MNMTDMGMKHLRTWKGHTCLPSRTHDIMGHVDVKPMTKPIEMEDVGAGGTVREPVPICRIHNSFLTVNGVDPVLGIRSTARSDCREETLDMGLAYDFLTLKADAV